MSAATASSTAGDGAEAAASASSTEATQLRGVAIKRLPTCDHDAEVRSVCVKEIKRQLSAPCEYSSSQASANNEAFGHVTWTARLQLPEQLFFRLDEHGALRFCIERFAQELQALCSAFNSRQRISGDALRNSPANIESVLKQKMPVDCRSKNE